MTPKVRRCSDCPVMFRSRGTENRCWECFVKVSHQKYPQFLQELSQQDERRKLLESILPLQEGVQRDPDVDPSLVRYAYDRVENVSDPAPILYAKKRRRIAIKYPNSRTVG